MSVSTPPSNAVSSVLVLHNPSNVVLITILSRLLNTTLQEMQTLKDSLSQKETQLRAAHEKLQYHAKEEAKHRHRLEQVNLKLNNLSRIGEKWAKELREYKGVGEMHEDEDGDDEGHEDYLEDEGEEWDPQWE